jgi:hypothetical protein
MISTEKFHLITCVRSRLIPKQGKFVGTKNEGNEENGPQNNECSINKHF